VRLATRRAAKGLAHQVPEPTFVVRLETRRTTKRVVHRAPWTNLCRAPYHVAHGKGRGQPCALTILYRAPCPVVHGKECHCSHACSAAHGREGVTPSPRGRPSTPFLCRASHITHGNKLCRALPFPKAHGKVLYRVKMHRAPFAVRLGKMRTATAKSAIPVVAVGDIYRECVFGQSQCKCHEHDYLE
jgi:hypothetical protein